MFCKLQQICLASVRECESEPCAAEELHERHFPSSSHVQSQHKLIDMTDNGNKKDSVQNCSMHTCCVGCTIEAIDNNSYFTHAHAALSVTEGTLVVLSEAIPVRSLLARDMGEVVRGPRCMGATAVLLVAGPRCMGAAAVLLVAGPRCMGAAAVLLVAGPRCMGAAAVLLVAGPRCMGAAAVLLVAGPRCMGAAAVLLVTGPWCMGAAAVLLVAGPQCMGAAAVLLVAGPWCTAVLLVAGPRCMGAAAMLLRGELVRESSSPRQRCRWWKALKVVWQLRGDPFDCALLQH